MQTTIEINHTTDAANNRNKVHNRCSQAASYIFLQLEIDSDCRL